MKSDRIFLLAFARSCALAFAADNPFDAFKGKMKEGLYDYKMEIDMSGMPGLPPGMGKQTHAFQKCVTAKDIEKGQMGRGAGRDGKMPETSEFSTFKIPRNTARYTITSTHPPLSPTTR